MHRIRLLIAALILISPLTANADLIEITATAVVTGELSIQFTDFSIIYDDASGDGLLQIEEIVSFSGTEVFSPGFPALSIEFGSILTTAFVPEISSFSGLAAFSFSVWVFEVSKFGEFPFLPVAVGDPVGVDSGFWTYSESIVSVPEPSTLALLSIGLFGFGLARRKKMVWTQKSG